MWYWIVFLLFIFITVVFFLIWANNNRIRLTSPTHPDHESYSSYVSVLDEHANEDQQYSMSPSLSFTKNTVSQFQSIVKNKPIIVKDNNLHQYNSSKIMIKEAPSLHIDKKENVSIHQDSTPIVQDSTPIVQDSTPIVQDSTPIIIQYKEKESTHPFDTLVKYAEETVLEKQYPKDNGPVPEKVCLSCLTGF
jgi:hypothetical protein